MIRFFRDIFVYSVLVIQFIVLGPYSLQAANRSDGRKNNRTKVSKANNPSANKQSYSQNRAAIKNKHGKNKAIGTNPSAETHVPSKHSKAKTNETKAQDNQQNTSTAKAKNANPQRPNPPAMGPLESALVATPEKISDLKRAASIRFQKLVGKMKREIKDAKENKESSVVKRAIVNGSTYVYKAWPGTHHAEASAYYKNQTSYYSEQLNQKLTFETGSPTLQILGDHRVREYIDIRFEANFNNFIDHGGFKETFTAMQLAERIIQIYFQSAQQTLTDPYLEIEGAKVGVSPAEFKEHMAGPLRDAIEVGRGAQLNWAAKNFQFFKNMFSTKHNYGIDVELKKSIYRTVPIRSLILLPIETIYFFIAGIGATYAQLAFDNSVSPTWFEDSVHHLGDLKGAISFGSFIAASRAFQAFTPVINQMLKNNFGKGVFINQATAGYLGMGVGGVTSHFMGEVLNHPAFDPFVKGLTKSFKAALAGRDEESAQWERIFTNAWEVLQYEFTSGKWWAKQGGQVTALIGSSIAAKYISSGLNTMTLGKMNFQKLARQRVATLQMAKSSEAVASTAKTVKVSFFGSIGSGNYRQAAAVAVKKPLNFLGDLKYVTIRLLGSTVVGKIWQFALFLFADPFIRPLIRPVDIQRTGSTAYEAMLGINDLKQGDRQHLDDMFYMNRLTMAFNEEPRQSYYHKTRRGRKEYKKNASTSGHKSYNFSKSNEIFKLFKDYFDAKADFRYNIMEEFEQKRHSWDMYMQNFTNNYVSMKQMYPLFLDTMRDAKERAEQNNIPLVSEDMFNFLNFPAYQVLNKDTQDIFKTYLYNYSTDIRRERSAGFDDFDYMEWMTKLGNFNLEGLKNKSVFKRIKGTRPGDFGVNDSHFVYLRNGTPERLLWGMAFGPDPRKEKIFEVPLGSQMTLEFPRITRSDLGFDPLDASNIKFNDALVEIDRVAADFSSPTAQNNYTNYNYPITSLEWRVVRDDGVIEWMNIFEIILYYLDDSIELPTSSVDILFGSSDAKSEDTQGVSEYLDKYVYCRGSTGDGKNCSDESLKAFYDDAKFKQLSLFKNLGSEIFSSDLHQANSFFGQTVKFFNTAYSYSMSKALTGVASPMGPGPLDKIGWTVYADRNTKNGTISPEQIRDANIKDLHVGARNPIFSIVEDLAAGTAFIDMALPLPTDFNEEESPELVDRASKLAEQNYRTYIQNAYLNLSMNLFDLVSDSTNNWHGVNLSKMQDQIEEIEKTYNKAMCYFRGKNPSPANGKEDGVITFATELGDRRFYRTYDKASDQYRYTLIDKNHFCDIDQIQTKLEASASAPSDFYDINSQEMEISVDHWNKPFMQENKDPLEPSLATPAALANLFNVNTNEQVFGVVFDLLSVDVLQFSGLDAQASRAWQDKVENIEMSKKNIVAQGHPLAAFPGIKDYRNNDGLVQVDTRMDSVQEKKQKLVTTIAQFEQLNPSQIKLESVLVTRPVSSLRSAIASKSIDMMKKAINAELSSYFSIFKSMQKFTPHEFDLLVADVCVAREHVKAAYLQVANMQELESSKYSMCNQERFLGEREDIEKLWEMNMDAIAQLRSQGAINDETYKQIEEQKKVNEDAENYDTKQFSIYWWDVWKDIKDVLGIN